MAGGQVPVSKFAPKPHEVCVWNTPDDTLDDTPDVTPQPISTRSTRTHKPHTNNAVFERVVKMGFHEKTKDYMY